MAQGFLAFALAAVFLLALVASGSTISNPPSDSSFQKYRALQLQDLAIKRVIYSSSSGAAAAAVAAAEAAQADPYAAALEAVRLNLAGLEQSFSSSDYAVALWCGSPPEGSMRQASSSMASAKAALLPEGASPIGSPQCRSAFALSILDRKIHFSSAGFSAYFPQFGAGIASSLPSGFEVGF